VDWLAVAQSCHSPRTDGLPLKIGLAQGISSSKSVRVRAGTKQQRTLETKHFPTWNYFLTGVFDLWSNSAIKMDGCFLFFS